MIKALAVLSRQVSVAVAWLAELTTAVPGSWKNLPDALKTAIARSVQRIRCFGAEF